MKPINTLTSAALVLSMSAGAALANGQHQAVGKIEHLDPRKHQLTLKHKTYRYDPRTVGSPVHVGDAVKVHFRNAHGHRVIDKISRA